MHLHSKLRLSGSVALLAVWLAFVSVSACGNPVLVDTVLVGGSCAAACEAAAAPRWLDLYNSVSGCACGTCSKACFQSACEEKTAPSDASLPCVQAGLVGDACTHHAGLFQSCNNHPECQAIIDCLLACPNK